MAQVTIRANLSTVQIPLLTEEFGRSVIVRQQDLNYNPTLAAKSDIDKDVGIPQAYYAHNVMPTNYGYKSVAYSTQLAGIGLSTFGNVFSLLSALGEKAFISFNTDGSVYTCSNASGYVWTQMTGVKKLTITEGTNTGTGYVGLSRVKAGGANDTYTVNLTSATAFNVLKNAVLESTGTVGTEYVSADTKVSFTVFSADTAFVAGDTFSLVIAAADTSGDVTKTAISGKNLLAVAGTGVFEYDFTSNTLTYCQLTGIDSTILAGITSANGYLIAYSSDSVLWSSLVDIFDFLPSLSTGAGGGSVEDAKGPIRKVVALTSGFIVFTAANAVAASFAQNIRYPFIFREIPNAGGVSDLSLVTDESDSTSVYAFTSYGLQQISTQKATSVMPEISDFLSGGRFEDFDTATLFFSVLTLTQPLKKRIEYISGRYLVISYGLTSLTHAIVYDTVIQRYGKLKFPHVASFQYGFLDADTADTARKQIAFLKSDGTVHALEFNQNSASPDSVILIGKFQYIRSRVMRLADVEVESVDSDKSLACYSYATKDGKTFSGFPILGYSIPSEGTVRSFKFHTTGLNHSLLLKGNFNLNSLVLTFSVGGSR